MQQTRATSELKISTARHADRPRQRGLLLAGSTILFLAPLAFIETSAHWASEPDLYQLLRGMAGIKAVLALSGLAAVWWRLGQTPVSGRFFASYVGGVWALALAAGLIWQLTAIVAASVLFHTATIVLLVSAWRDVEPGFARRSA